MHCQHFVSDKGLQLNSLRHIISYDFVFLTLLDLHLLYPCSLHVLYNMFKVDCAQRVQPPSRHLTTTESDSGFESRFPD